MENLQQLRQREYLMIIKITVKYVPFLSHCYRSFCHEPRCEKTGLFAYAKTKTQISFVVTAKLISAFVFATRIVQSLYFLNPKFQASSHLLWLYSLVCIGHGRKPRILVFSERGSHAFLTFLLFFIIRVCNIVSFSGQVLFFFHFVKVFFFH